ncbi:hypothetical protein PCC7418_2756 [Halothece sp. PCC 7418]|nr:hypothetical protein PCC7418_2756 [Halothece sp. PCC 7418]
MEYYQNYYYPNSAFYQRSLIGSNKNSDASEEESETNELN